MYVYLKISKLFQLKINKLIVNTSGINKKAVSELKLGPFGRVYLCKPALIRVEWAS